MKSIFFSQVLVKLVRSLGIVNIHMFFSEYSFNMDQISVGYFPSETT